MDGPVVVLLWKDGKYQELWHPSRKDHLSTFAGRSVYELYKTGNITRVRPGCLVCLLVVGKGICALGRTHYRVVRDGDKKNVVLVEWFNILSPDHPLFIPDMNLSPQSAHYCDVGLARKILDGWDRHWSRMR